MTTFKKIKINGLFDIHPTDSYNQMTNLQLFARKGDTPVLSNTSRNNGIGGYSALPPTENGNMITYSDTTQGIDTIFYQPDPFIGYSHIQGMYPWNPEKWNRQSLLYFISCMKKSAGNMYSYSIKFTRDIVNNLEVELPVDSQGKIDFQYMSDHMDIATDQSIDMIERYLKEKVHGYELTAAEKKALETQPEVQNFKLATTYESRGKVELVDTDGLFEIEPTAAKLDAQLLELDKGDKPYVSRGDVFGSNGIRGYINYDTSCLNPGNTISFGQDTAVIKYQPQDYFTGDKILIFSLNPDYGLLNAKRALYLITILNKVFYNYEWGQQSFAADKIAYLDVPVPVTPSGRIDFNYMETYISAIEKMKAKELATKIIKV